MHSNPYTLDTFPPNYFKKEMVALRSLIIFVRKQVSQITVQMGLHLCELKSDKNISDKT